MHDWDEQSSQMAQERIDVSAILEQAYAPGGKARLQRDRALGPDPECLSIADIERVAEEGLSGPALEHYLECKDCARIVSTHLQRLRSSNPRLIERQKQRAAAAAGIWAKLTSWVHSQPEIHPALLGFSERVFKVSESGETRDVRVRIVPFSKDHLEAHELPRFRLEGCMLANSADIKVVDVDKDGRPDIWDVTFTNVVLAPQVKASINNDQNVIDWVTVSGTFNSDKTELFGEARLEFQPVRLLEA